MLQRQRCKLAFDPDQSHANPGCAGPWSKSNLRPGFSWHCYPVGGVGMLRKMFEHYRMLRFERYGRWQSAKGEPCYASILTSNHR
jgi:hypothetical protein